MALTISREQTQNGSVLHVSGEINVVTATILDEAMKPWLDEDNELVLDMKDCVYISSAGIRVLLSAYKKLHARDADLRLIHVRETIEEVLNCTGLDSLFLIEKEENQ